MKPICEKPKLDVQPEAAASRWHTEAERRFMIDKAEVYRRVADAIEPQPSKVFGE